MQCPHCRTDIRVLLRTPDECPHCGRALKDEAGRTLREIDRDFDGLLERLDRQTFRRIKTGTVVCVGLSVLAMFFYVVMAPLIVVQTWIWARPLVSAPYGRHFSPARRMVTRWLSRFLVFFMAGWHAHLVIAGLHFLAPLTSGFVFVATCGTTWAYHRFQLRREHDRQPILLVEKILLVIAGILALGMFVGLVFLTSVLAYILKALQGA